MLHVTELMASEFGLITAAVRLIPATGVASAQAFLVTDVDGGQWRLESCRSHPQVIGKRRNIVRSHPTRGRRVVQRWGLQWTLIARRAASGEGTVRYPPGMPAAPRWKRPGDGGRVPADGHAGVLPWLDDPVLERVGSWLQQPAGLPMARDILGQCFMEAWLENRERIVQLHRRAESLHDACDGECGEQPGRAGVAQVEEWHRLRRVLRHLVECQRVLLGPQAQVTPVALRRRALQRMRALLADDAMQVERGSAPLHVDVFSRAEPGTT